MDMKASLSNVISDFDVHLIANIDTFQSFNFYTGLSGIGSYCLSEKKIDLVGDDFLSVLNYKLSNSRFDYNIYNSSLNISILFSEHFNVLNKRFDVASVLEDLDEFFLRKYIYHHFSVSDFEEILFVLNYCTSRLEKCISHFDPLFNNLIYSCLNLVLEYIENSNLKEYELYLFSNSLIVTRTFKILLNLIRFERFLLKISFIVKYWVLKNSFLIPQDYKSTIFLLNTFFIFNAFLQETYLSDYIDKLSKFLNFSCISSIFSSFNFSSFDYNSGFSCGLDLLCNYSSLFEIDLLNIDTHFLSTIDYSKFNFNRDTDYSLFFGYTGYFNVISKYYL